MKGRYHVIQPYGRRSREATIIESFNDIEDAFEALDWMAQRRHEQGDRSGAWRIQVQ